MPRPNFLIAGAPKCGTTAMWRYLNEHPDVWLSQKKDLHYFGSDLGFTKRKRLDEESYLSYFEGADGIHIGEASVWYMMSKNAAREIHDFDPNMRIIMMLRDPVTVMYAHYTQMLFNGLGYEDQKSFADALELEASRKNGKDIPKNSPMREAYLYREIVHFSEQLERYRSVFPPEQLLVILQEDMISDTAEVYRKTLDFLGADTDQLIEFKRVNSNKVVRFESLRRLIALTPSGIKDLIPSKTREKISRSIRSLNSRHEKRKALDPDLEKELREELHPEIRRISALLNRNLDHWAG